MSAVQTSFALPEIRSLSAMEHYRLDRLPYGVIKLDPEGNVIFYNTSEEVLAGRKRDDVVGKNFFTEVAPCTNVREFAGVFREGVRNRSLHTTFSYIFNFRMKPKAVWVTLYWCNANASAWVMVRERDG